MMSSDIKSLKKGDTVIVSFEAKVLGNGGRFSVYAEDKNGDKVHFIDRKAAAADGYPCDEGFPFGQVDITLVKRADPENWPPKPGDVWRGKSGKEYHFLGTGGSSWDTDNRFINKEHVLRDEPFLIHRKVR